MLRTFKTPLVRIKHIMQGFSLLEVLIALAILSIGLLGLAGLQMVSLRYNQSAGFRSQATQSAQEIVDAMRANPVEAKAGRYDHTMGSAIESASPIAAIDLWRWRQTIRQRLPAGDGSVCRTTTPTAAPMVCTGNGNFIVVRIQWTDAGDSNSGGNRGTNFFEFVTQL